MARRRRARLGMAAEEHYEKALDLFQRSSAYFKRADVAIEQSRCDVALDQFATGMSELAEGVAHRDSAPHRARAYEEGRFAAAAADRVRAALKRKCLR